MTARENRNGDSMLEDLLVAGDRIILRRERMDSEEPAEIREYAGGCSGRIYKVLSDSQFVMEIGKEISETIQKKRCYLLFLYTGTKIYECSAYFQHEYEEENKQFAVLEIVSPLQKVSRRRYLRYSCHTPLSFSVLQEQSGSNEMEESGDRELLTRGERQTGNTMVDISGGGICFTSQCELEPGTEIRMFFAVPVKGQTRQIEVSGSVLSSLPMKNKADWYEIRIRYTGLSEEKRKELIRIVFQLERVDRKKDI